MNHHEIEELLGAYALDAVEIDEKLEIEAHLSECPRCRAEVAAYRDVASMLASSHAEAPNGLWDKIASLIEVPTPIAIEDGVPQGIRTKSRAHRNGAATRKIGRRMSTAILASAGTIAAAAIVVLAFEVGSLHSQTQRLESAMSRSGLSGAVARAAVAPHRTVSLLADDHSVAATVIVSPGGDAFWISSSLRRLPSDRTYQLWGLSFGHVVSLGLLGSDPHSYSGFRVESSVTRLMVTSEPIGGSAAPTSPVIAQGVT